MKKVILVLCILFSAVVFANNEILLELKGLENEYEILVKEEETRFQKERELSEKAAAQNIDLEKLKASIEEKLATAPEERKKRYF